MTRHLTIAVGIFIFLYGANIKNSFSQEMKLFGRVLDETDHLPIHGASVTVVGQDIRTYTDAKGDFSMAVFEGDSIAVTMIGFKPERFMAELRGRPIEIRLAPSISSIEEVDIISTGYQQLPRDRSTGSFDVLNREMIERSVSADLLSRLENLSPGLLFNRGDAEGTDPFLVRGRSTITADAQPLIVLDDFPYDGDINNINPNDIERVTILKDAAAASIWGARAANGVIVITTKRGKSPRPRVEFNSNTKFQGRPDLFNVSMMGSMDRIEWERMLFESGRYAAAEAAGTLASRVAPIPEAVEMMISGHPKLDVYLDELASRDIRNDVQKHMYRNSINQQHSLGVSGASQYANYSFNMGYDRNAGSLVGDNSQRVTLRSSTTIDLSEKLQLSGSLQLALVDNKHQGNEALASGGAYGFSPYARLVDEHGNALPYFADYRQGFLDTAGHGNLLDWEYRPLDEIGLRQRTNIVRDYLAKGGLNYKLLDGLVLDFKYQYQHQTVEDNDIYDETSYRARNLINRFTQMDPTNGAISYPFPLGGLLQSINHAVSGHQGRLQFAYTKRWQESHELDAIAGYEVRSKVTSGFSHFQYGYRRQYGVVNSMVDFVDRYPVNTQQNTEMIPRGASGEINLTDNFLSAYGNAAYTYRSKYTISGSVRKDEANLFGVSSNMKGVPLWSAGVSWTLSNEEAYGLSWMPDLKLRATYGINGNISRATSAMTRVLMSSGGQLHRYPSATIQRPPNANLRWEQVKMLNLGLDFGLWQNMVSGSIEYYRKDAVDLIANAPTDPTIGFSSMFANVASMSGSGVDLQVNAVLTGRRWGWTGGFLYSYSAMDVTEYLMPGSAIGRTYAASMNNITPIVGMPLYTAFSFPWAGLDPENGDPRSYVDGEVSTDYNAIFNGSSVEDMQYHGSVQPVHFGAILNAFNYGDLGISFNTSFKFGYYFRTPSVVNSGLVNAFSGHGDYNLRWRNPGDERFTDVPAMIYPAVINRDNVYQYASIHVHRADHIRLEDFNISYTLRRANRKLPFQSARFFVYCSDLGIVWVANRKGVDPYYNNVPLPARSLAVGINMTF